MNTGIADKTSNQGTINNPDGGLEHARAQDASRGARGDGARGDGARGDRSYGDGSRSDGAHEPQGKRSILAAIAVSPLVWILITLFVFDLFISNVKPLKYVSIPGVVLRDQDAIDDRMSVLLSPIDRSNTLLMGCSMAASATANADIAASGRPMSEDARRRYMRCEYFDSKARKQLGLNANSLGLGIAANMISCNLRVLNKAIESGKTPKMVVLMVAPRAFIDNTREEPQYPVNLYFAWRFRDSSSIKDLQSAVDFALSRIWTFYGLRSDYEVVASQAGCAIFGRAATLYEALSTTGDALDPKNKISFTSLSEIYDAEKHATIPQQNALNKYYLAAYQPLNRKRFEKQMSALEEFLSVCKENKIDCIVVDMPLAKYNRKLLAPGFEAELRQRIAAACQTGDAKFIDLMDDSRFSKVDFTDTVHLTGEGAVKFWNAVLSELSKDAAYVDRVKRDLQ